MPYDNMILKAWLREVGPTRRKIILSKLKQDLDDRGLTEPQVYNALLQIVARNAQVQLTRIHTLRRPRYRSSATLDIEDTCKSLNIPRETIDQGVHRSPEASLSLSSIAENCEPTAAKRLKTNDDSLTVKTPELLDENVGSGNPLLVRIPRTAITLNLNSYATAKTNLPQARSSPEIRLADSSVPDLPLSDKTTTKEKCISSKDTKKPKIVEDLTCLEGTIFSRSSLQKMSQIPSSPMSPEKIEEKPKTDILTTKKERLNKKFRSLFGSDVSLNEGDEEKRLIAKLSAKKRRKESRMSSDSGVCLGEMTSDSISLEMPEKRTVIISDEIYSSNEAKIEFSERIEKSMPSLDEICEENMDEINGEALPDSSTNLEEKSSSSVDSSSSTKLTILITPVNTHDDDAFDPLRLELDLSNDTQISTPTSTTTCLPIVEATNVEKPFEDIEKFLAMDVTKDCHISIKSNTIRIDEDITSLVASMENDEDDDDVDEEFRLIIDDSSSTEISPSSQIGGDSAIVENTKQICFSSSNVIKEKEKESEINSENESTSQKTISSDCELRTITEKSCNKETNGSKNTENIAISNEQNDCVMERIVEKPLNTANPAAQMYLGTEVFSNNMTQKLLIISATIVDIDNQLETVNGNERISKNSNLESLVRESCSDDDQISCTNPEDTSRFRKILPKPNTNLENLISESQQQVLVNESTNRTEISELPDATTPKIAPEVPNSAIPKIAPEVPNSAIPKIVPEVPNSAIPKITPEVPNSAIPKIAPEVPNSAIPTISPEVANSAIPKIVPEVPESALSSVMPETANPKEIPVAPKIRVLHYSELGSRWCPTPMTTNPQNSQLPNPAIPSQLQSYLTSQSFPSNAQPTPLDHMQRLVAQSSLPSHAAQDSSCRRQPPVYPGNNFVYSNNQNFPQASSSMMNPTSSSPSNNGIPIPPVAQDSSCRRRPSIYPGNNFMCNNNQNFTQASSSMTNPALSNPSPNGIPIPAGAQDSPCRRLPATYPGNNFISNNNQNFTQTNSSIMNPSPNGIPIAAGAQDSSCRRLPATYPGNNFISNNNQNFSQTNSSMTNSASSSPANNGIPIAAGAQDSSCRRLPATYPGNNFISNNNQNFAQTNSPMTNSASTSPSNNGIPIAAGAQDSSCRRQPSLNPGNNFICNNNQNFPRTSPSMMNPTSSSSSNDQTSAGDHIMVGILHQFGKLNQLINEIQMTSSLYILNKLYSQFNDNKSLLWKLLIRYGTMIGTSFINVILESVIAFSNRHVPPDGRMKINDVISNVLSFGNRQATNNHAQTFPSVSSGVSLHVNRTPANNSNKPFNLAQWSRPEHSMLSEAEFQQLKRQIIMYLDQCTVLYYQLVTQHQTEEATKRNLEAAKPKRTRRSRKPGNEQNQNVQAPRVATVETVNPPVQKVILNSNPVLITQQVNNQHTLEDTIEDIIREKINETNDIGGQSILQNVENVVCPESSDRTIDERVANTVQDVLRIHPEGRHCGSERIERLSLNQSTVNNAQSQFMASVIQGQSVVQNTQSQPIRSDLQLPSVENNPQCPIVENNSECPSIENNQGSPLIQNNAQFLQNDLRSQTPENNVQIQNKNTEKNSQENTVEINIQKVTGVIVEPQANAEKVVDKRNEATDRDETIVQKVEFQSSNENVSSETLEKTVQNDLIDRSDKNVVLSTTDRDTQEDTVQTNSEDQTIEEEMAQLESVLNRSDSSTHDSETSVMEVLKELELLDALTKAKTSKGKKYKKDIQISSPEAMENCSTTNAAVEEQIAIPMSKEDEKADESTVPVPEISKIVETKSTKEVPVITIDDEDDWDVASVGSATTVRDVEMETIDEFSILEVKSISKDVFNSMNETFGVMDNVATIEDERMIVDDESIVLKTELCGCFRCGKESSVVCEQCRNAVYCSPECHKLHWTEIHYLTCKPTHTISSDIQEMPAAD